MYRLPLYPFSNQNIHSNHRNANHHLGLSGKSRLNAFNTLLILTGGVDRAVPGPAMGPALPAVNIEINLPDSSLLVIDNEATIRRFASEITARVRDDLRRQHSIDTR